MPATLAKYLDAAGVDAAAIVVSVKGRQFELISTSAQINYELAEHAADVRTRS